MGMSSIVQTVVFYASEMEFCKTFMKDRGDGSVGKALASQVGEAEFLYPECSKHSHKRRGDREEPSNSGQLSIAYAVKGP